MAFSSGSSCFFQFFVDPVFESCLFDFVEFFDSFGELFQGFAGEFAAQVAEGHVLLGAAFAYWAFFPASAAAAAADAWGDLVGEPFYAFDQVVVVYVFCGCCEEFEFSVAVDEC